MVTKNWFTKYLRQIREISDRDTTDPRISNLLGKTFLVKIMYMREMVGTELFQNFLCGWFDKFNPLVLKRISFFNGNYKVSQTQVDCLKRY